MPPTFPGSAVKALVQNLQGHRISTGDLQRVKRHRNEHNKKRIRRLPFRLHATSLLLIGDS